MNIFCKCINVNRSKLHFILVICFAKNLIWTKLKAIFSIFRFVCTNRFQTFKQSYLGQILSYHNKPYINGKLIHSAFVWCIHLHLKNWHLRLVLWSSVTYGPWRSAGHQRIFVDEPIGWWNHAGVVVGKTRSSVFARFNCSWCSFIHAEMFVRQPEIHAATIGLSGWNEW